MMESEFPINLIEKPLSFEKFLFLNCWEFHDCLCICSLPGMESMECLERMQWRWWENSNTEVPHHKSYAKRVSGWRKRHPSMCTTCCCQYGHSFHCHGQFLPHPQYHCSMLLLNNVRRHENHNHKETTTGYKEHPWITLLWHLSQSIFKSPHEGCELKENWIH